MPLDPAKVKVASSVKHGGVFQCLCREAGTDRFFAGSDDFAVHVIDLAVKKTEPVAVWKKHESYVNAVAACKVGGKTQVVSGGCDKQLVWWDGASGTIVRSLEGHQGWVRQMAVMPDGARLVTVGDDMLVKMWDLAEGKLIRSFTGHALQTPQGHVTALYSVAVSPDGKQLASGDRHGELRVWEAESGKLISTFQVPTLYTYDPRQRKRSMGGIRALAFSPDGTVLAAGGVGQIGNVDGLGGPIHLELWDWKKPQARVVVGAKKQQGMISALVFTPDGEWLFGAGGGGSGFVALWQVKTLPESKDKKETIPDHHLKFDGHAHGLVLDAKKNELYAAGYRKMDIWNLGS